MVNVHPLIVATQASLTAKGTTCHSGGVTAPILLAVEGCGDIVAIRVGTVFHGESWHEVLCLLNTIGETIWTVRDPRNVMAAIDGMLIYDDDDKADLARFHAAALDYLLDGIGENWAAEMNRIWKLVVSAVAHRGYLDQEEIVGLAENIERAIVGLTAWSKGRVTGKQRMHGRRLVNDLGSERARLLGHIN